jgi:hypothetical protein
MPYFEAKFKMENVKAMASWFTAKTESTRAIGSMITETERVWRGTLMETNMKAILLKVKLMEKEFISGLMEKYMMENGKTESKMATECGRAFLETVI